MGERGRGIGRDGVREIECVCMYVRETVCVLVRASVWVI